MHHVGYMAALNLIWFRAQPAIIVQSLLLTFLWFLCSFLF